MWPSGRSRKSSSYRDKRGTFTRSVTITFGIAVLIMLLVHGQTDLAAPFYGIGVFLPIMIMGLAIRQHMLQNFTGKIRAWGAGIALFAAVLSGSVFIGQLVGKWEEGGWIRLITFTTLFTSAHLVILSPVGYRDPKQIHRIVREKARVQGAMASIVEWQSLGCRNTVTACWLASPVSGSYLGSTARCAMTRL